MTVPAHPRVAVAEFAHAHRILEHTADVVRVRSWEYYTDPTDANRLVYRSALERWRDACLSLKAAEDLIITYQLPHLDAAQVEHINEHRIDRAQDADEIDSMIEFLDHLGDARQRLDERID